MTASTAAASLFCLAAIAVPYLCPVCAFGLPDDSVSLILSALGTISLGLATVNAVLCWILLFSAAKANAVWLYIGLVMPLLVWFLYPAIQSS
jgi:hypothetical protein